MLRGAIHIHSTYSDGDLTLPELRDRYAALGCSFLAMTDHAESFTGDSLRRYAAECEELSTPNFAMVAGLEFGCLDRMHVLGLGVTALAPSKDPQEVFGHVARHEGVSVIAHPMDTAFSWIESFAVPPAGIEVWNSKYDGRYAPRVATFDLVARLRKRWPGLRAFYGQDLHWRRQFHQLFVDVDAARPARAEILSAFARGAFEAVKGRWRLRSDGRLTDAQRAVFRDAHERSERIRGFVKKARGLVAKWGVPVPPGMKAQLRRIF
jgi:predicted metal-dependent phosphoesterase TrpH